MLIECKTGKNEQRVGGETYRFERDEHGRFVAEVHSLVHVQILLSVEHYQEVPNDQPETGRAGTFNETDFQEMREKHQGELEALALAHSKALSEREEAHTNAMKAQADAHALQLQKLLDAHTSELQKAKEEGRAEALELLAKAEADKPEVQQDEPTAKTQKKVSK